MTTPRPASTPAEPGAPPIGPYEVRHVEEWIHGVAEPYVLQDDLMLSVRTGNLVAVSKLVRRLRTALAAAGRDTERLTDLCEIAWGVIASAGGGDWTRESVIWQGAAEWWRNQYFALLASRAPTAPTPTPETERTE